MPPAGRHSAPGLPVSTSELSGAVPFRFRKTIAVPLPKTGWGTNTENRHTVFEIALMDICLLAFYSFGLLFFKRKEEIGGRMKC